MAGGGKGGGGRCCFSGDVSWFLSLAEVVSSLKHEMGGRGTYGSISTPGCRDRRLLNEVGGAMVE